MASPIWKAMWSAGTLTCKIVPFCFLMYSPELLSGLGTSCPFLMYMALANPAYVPQSLSIARPHCQALAVMTVCLLRGRRDSVTQ